MDIFREVIKMGSEINEVINNLCDKLGVAAEYLIPEMARVHIAQNIAMMITAFIISMFFVVVGIVIWRNIKKDEYPDYDPLFIYSLASLLPIVITSCVFFSSLYNLAGWIASPTAMTVTELAKLL